MAKERKNMKITEEMLYELLTQLNRRLKNDYIKNTIDKHIICNMMQIKKISVYNHNEKTQITITSKE